MENTLSRGMKLFALADPHLAHGTPGKEMDRFGEHWHQHAATIEGHWRQIVQSEDLVVVAGDVSWALKMAGAQPDLDFLASLPGTKILCRGNHDYWWSSLTKVRAALPDGMLAVGGDAVRLGSTVFAGTRLWDVPGVYLADLIDWHPDGTPPARTLTDEEIAQSEKIYQRELGRLRTALSALDDAAEDGDLRVCMVHYPPVNADLRPNELTELFEAHRIDHVIFGHLHSVRRDLLTATGEVERPFGVRNGVQYHLTACDYLDFKPTLIANLSQ